LSLALDLLLDGLSFVTKMRQNIVDNWSRDRPARRFEANQSAAASPIRRAFYIPRRHGRYAERGLLRRAIVGAGHARRAM